MKFSVIINCYNTLPIIRRCIEAVIESTDGHSEIILVNNHPPYPEVLAYLSQFHHPRVQILDPGQNLSHVLGTQFAVQHARGQYLIRMDDDCVVPRNNWAAAMAQALNHFRDLAYIGLPWPGIPLSGAQRASAPGITIEYADFVLFTCVMFRRQLWQAHFILPAQGIYGDDDSAAAQKAAALGLRRAYLVSHPCQHIGRTAECDSLYGAWKLLYHRKRTALDFAAWRRNVSEINPEEAALLGNFGYSEPQIEEIKTLIAKLVRA